MERDKQEQDAAPDAEESRRREEPDEKPPLEDEVDQASDESFPASDPPSY